MSTAFKALDLPSTSATFGSIDQILREPLAILDRIRSGEDLAGLARAAIVTIALCAAVFGAAMGNYRGGLQILYAALKLPAVVLLTAAICAPALSAINAALERPADLRRDLALVLAVLARGVLALAAQAPVLLLAESLRFEYHAIILIVFACCGLAGLVGLSLLVRGIAAERNGRWPAALALLTVFALVGAQMSWMLRPYVVRPRTPVAPLVRQIESNAFESFGTSADSARGVYHRRAPEAP